MPLEPGATLCDSLMRLVMQVLACGEYEALVHLKHRVAGMSTGNRLMSEFLEVDDIHEVIDRSDKQAIEQHKKSAAATIVSAGDFVSEFSAKVRSYKPVPKQAAKRARKAPPGSAGSAPAPNRIPLGTHIEQWQAKLFAPFGASVWVDKFAGSWQGHLPPFSRVSRSFRKWTEQGALREVLKSLWQSHCVVEGTPLSECPMKGLFDTATGAESSSASSAAPSALAASSR